MSPFLIGIAGGTGSGKTTIARRLAAMLESRHTICLFDLDSYYKDLSFLPAEEREQVNFDHPDAVDLDRFQEDLCRLKQGQAVRKPNYDYGTHRRFPEATSLVSGDVVIAEGLMLFVRESLRDLFDFRVFLDTPADVRVTRRLERDVRERGRGLAGAITQYLNSVRPMHDQFIEPTKHFAHYILPGSDDSESAWTELASMIQLAVRREERVRPSSVGS